jgi:hypothetical protein
MGQEDLGGNLLTLCNLSAGDEALLKIIGDLFLKVPQPSRGTIGAG